MFLLILLLNLLSGILTSPNNQSHTAAPSHITPSRPAPSPPAPSRPAPSRPNPSQDETTTTKHPLKIASKNTKKSTASKTKDVTTKILGYLRRILKIQTQQQQQLKSIQLQMGSKKLKEVVTLKTPKSHTVEMDGRDE